AAGRPRLPAPQSRSSPRAPAPAAAISITVATSFRFCARLIWLKRSASTSSSSPGSSATAIETSPITSRARPGPELDRDRNVADTLAHARRAQYRASDLHVALDQPARAPEHGGAWRSCQVRDQHFAAAIGDDLDLLAFDLRSELERHPDFRRPHHAALNFYQPAAARFVK